MFVLDICYPSLILIIYIKTQTRMLNMIMHNLIRLYLPKIWNTYKENWIEWVKRVREHLGCKAKHPIRHRRTKTSVPTIIKYSMLSNIAESASKRYIIDGWLDKDLFIAVSVRVHPSKNSTFHINDLLRLVSCVWWKVCVNYPH